MSRSSTALLTALTLALGPVTAGCGGGELRNVTNTPQAQRAKRDAERIATACIKRGGGVTAIARCAVPPHHGLAFVKCVVSGASTSVPALESTVVRCGERYR